MLIECFAIVALIAAIFVIYLRMKGLHMSLSILPLASVPCMHILVQLILVWLASFMTVDVALVVTVADIAALVASALFCGTFSYCYGKKARVTYLIVVGLFNVTLTCILLANL